MDIDTFIEHFTGALEDLPDAPLTPDTVFKALKAWDSLAVLTVTDTIDIEYGVLLKKADFASCESIHDLFQLVMRKRQARGS